MGEGSALSSSTSSLTLVAVPSLVDIVRVADLPAFLKARNMSNMEANSSTIFSTESELILRLWRSSKFCFLSLSLFFGDQKLNIFFEVFVKQMVH